MRVSITDISVVDILRQDFFADCSGCLDGDRMTGKPEVISANPIRVIYFGLADNTSAERLQLDVARVV
jgi:hypothetical protein